MTDKIKKGITLLIALLAMDVALSAVVISLTFVLLYSHNYIAMFVSIGLSAMFAYAIPFLLAELLWHFNAARVSSMAIKLNTTDPEAIADGLTWRLKPTIRVIKKCVKRKYI